MRKHVLQQLLVERRQNEKLTCRHWHTQEPTENRDEMRGGQLVKVKIEEGARKQQKQHDRSLEEEEANARAGDGDEHHAPRRHD